MYDYLIVGAGLYGSVCAHELSKKGFRVCVIDKRDHIGGNCYTDVIDSITFHKYGPHIFHTSDKSIWEYVNSLVTFNDYRYNPKVYYRGNLYSFPINLLTLHQVLGITTPQQAKDHLESVRLKIGNPANFEEWILSKIGVQLYEMFIKGYTAKQWGRSPSTLPVDIIKRLPIRLTFDDNYYFDTYQGIPIGGYTKVFERLLENVEVHLSVDYLSSREYYNSKAHRIIYTGAIDEFFNNIFGKLEYRSLRFETEKLQVEDFQGTAGMNYTDIDIPFTRIIEHKHFEGSKTEHTIITREYPEAQGEPFYPINDEVNNSLYRMYRELADREQRVIFGGRLAEYKYYDMHQVISAALSTVDLELKKYQIT